MKTLKFSREKARKQYLKDVAKYPYLHNRNNRELELLLLRNELLTRNPLYVREWKELNLLDPKRNFEVYDEKIKEFSKRWNVDSKGMYLKDRSYEIIKPLRIGKDKYPSSIALEIDLRFTKRRILNELKHVIDVMKDVHSELITPPLVKGNVLQDFKDYELYLKVWDLKNNGKSWSQIQEELKLNSIQTGRNAYKVAQKLISEGLPTYPPFPQDTIC